MRHPNSAPFDPMSDLPAEIQFCGSHGERCLRLLNAWHLVFDHINRLGSLFVGYRTGALTLLVRHSSMDFQPVPDGKEWIDLNSGWILDTDMIGSAIAVDERATGRQLEFSIQFFNGRTGGLFKLILTDRSHREAFGLMLRTLAVQNRCLCHRAILRSKIAQTHPVEALDVGTCSLIKTLLMAHFHRVPLRFTLSTVSGVYATSFVPHRLERSGDDFLIADAFNEIHLANVPALRVRRTAGARRADRLMSVVFELTEQQECCVEFAGSNDQMHFWANLHGCNFGPD